jgi:hypothetical protein
LLRLADLATMATRSEPAQTSARGGVAPPAGA